MSGKMKRKGFDEVYEDLPHFSVSAPALKIRRLDADLHLMEEQFIPPVIEKQPPEEETTGLMRNEPTLNEERGLVLYRPPEVQLCHSFKIDPKLFSGLKNYKLGSENSNAVVIEEAYEQDDQSSLNGLALVPWVPFHAPVTGEAIGILSSGNEAVKEPMEAEGSDAAEMEIEEDDGLPGKAGVASYTFQPRQHCMIPELLQKPSATVMW